MNPTIVGTVVFTCAFVGTLLGMWLRSIIPKDHLDAEARDTVKIGIGLVATMTALVLGLVTASAKSSFDAMDSAVKNSAIEVLSLDRALARYGPETATIRTSLQRAVGARIEMIWPQTSSKPADVDPMKAGVVSAAEGLVNAIRALNPQDDSQRALQSRSLDLAEALLQTRWLAQGGNETSVPGLFLVVLLFWLTITFGSYGLLAPRNATVFAVLFVCSLSVGGAVFLVLELDTPFAGLLKVSSEPFHYALAHLNR